TGSQGQNNLSLSLAGTNFQASPSCSFGAGITVNSCTYNSSTQLTANISIASNATVGARNVTVTNVDNQSTTLASGFSVQTAPPPTLTSATPNTGSQGQNNLGVTLAGSNFQASPSCSFGAGITVNSCTYNSSTHVCANISIASNATVGARNVTVTNVDNQSATLASGFSVQTVVVNPPPTISSANPNSGSQGQSNLAVTLAG